jgi:polysaccharide biosynthesis/export protein VpsN
VSGSRTELPRRRFLGFGLGLGALAAAGVAAGGALAAGCVRGRPVARVAIEAPEESTTLGPGDRFTFQIGEDHKDPAELTVDSDGTAELPYLHRVKVAGLEPQDLARTARDQLRERDFFTDPSVVVRVTEYRSKLISILGQVQRPGSFPFQPGMTLVQGISLAGGMNAIAKSQKIRLTRKLKQGGTRSVVLDFDAINSGYTEDPLLQAGDRIFVEERVF